MKRVLRYAPMALFAWVAVALWVERPVPPDDALFGAGIALHSELAPLEVPLGDLRIQGRVHASDGTPAADALVVLLRPDEDPSEAFPALEAYTDAAGAFALDGLTRGTYRVILQHPSAPPRSFMLEVPVTDAVDWALAQPLDPLPVLPEIVRAPCTGHVLLPATIAASLAGFEVVFYPAVEGELSGAAERRATTDEAGSFAFDDLVVGEYRVEVLPPWARGGTWPVLGRARATTRLRDPEPLELVLGVGALEGRVLESADLPIPGALVKLVSMERRDAIGEPQLWPPSVSDPNGHFRVELLPPGRYQLHLRAGAAARDVEVAVESGKVTDVPLGTLSPRAQENAPGS